MEGKQIVVHVSLTLAELKAMHGGCKQPLDEVNYAPPNEHLDSLIAQMPGCEQAQRGAPVPEEVQTKGLVNEASNAHVAHATKPTAIATEPPVWEHVRPSKRRKLSTTWCWWGDRCKHRERCRYKHNDKTAAQKPSTAQGEAGCKEQQVKTRWDQAQGVRTRSAAAWDHEYIASMQCKTASRIQALFRGAVARMKLVAAPGNAGTDKGHDTAGKPAGHGDTNAAERSAHDDDDALLDAAIHLANQEREQNGGGPPHLISGCGAPPSQAQLDAPEPLVEETAGSSSCSSSKRQGNQAGKAKEGQTLRCPDHHELVLARAMPGTCDGCFKPVKKNSMAMQCERCRWYLCKRCWQSRKQNANSKES